MNELMSEKLSRLSKDENLLMALNEIFNERIEKEKPIIGLNDTDETIGQKYRAYNKAKEILNGLITDINSHNINKKESNGFNKAK
jgi:hypothetical protein